MTREEAIKIIDCYDIGFYDLSGEKIPADKLADAFDMAIEALQSEPAKHGEWAYSQNKEYCIRADFKALVCNICGCNIPNVEQLPKNYCPNCGAKMKGGAGK